MNLILEPVFKNLSPRAYHIILVAVVILMYSCCVETDIYVPAFPQMLEFFNVAENQIQLVLSINFIGLCIASFIVGPLADCFGRRIVILAGLTLFMISSIILLLVNDFYSFLFWRFLQGVATAVPMVCAGAMFMDKYSSEHASKLIGIINSFITAAMAAAPIIGAFLTEMYGWKSNFVAVMFLSVISFLGFFLFIEESLAKSARRELRFIKICKDFLKIIKNPLFNCYVLLACLPFITIIVYITSLSVIFVNHLNIDLVTYSYYQATTMGTFVVFSIASVKFIAKAGVAFTHNMGLIFSFIGSLLLFIIALIDHTNIDVISLSMALVAAGGALMAGTFGMKALSIYPEMNATALSVATMLRLFMVAFMVFLSEIYFDGTIIPIAILIFTYSLIVTIFYIGLIVRGKT